MKSYDWHYKDRKTGIKVTIRPSQNRYDVDILIPHGTFNYSKKITISNKNFTLAVEATEEKSIGPYYININKGYQNAKYGLIKNVNASLKFQTNQCFGTIVLRPKFYIPKSRLATPQRLKKTQELKKCEITLAAPNPSVPKYTMYSRTNIAKPYSGGKVSPK